MKRNSNNSRLKKFSQIRKLVLHLAHCSGRLTELGTGKAVLCHRINPR